MVTAISALTGGRPARCGQVHFLPTRRRRHRGTVPGVITRCARSVLGHMPDQRGENGAAGPVQPGLGLGAAQHGNLVPQHEQFDVLGRGGPAEQEQPAAEPGEDQAEQTERHG